ncbi:hypothetical protein BpHYR1_047887 [Brachionus plicatilis]|uniref:Uncharacterized protein n=1 Tax=Brachionus plicatilis TaxID=10195 RepID=A0A3M7T8M1_BRAPC|nr:hypothetical protein BpHYR1_047887 [Brachionus plicatilis]
MAIFIGLFKSSQHDNKKSENLFAIKLVIKNVSIETNFGIPKLTDVYCPLFVKENGRDLLNRVIKNEQVCDAIRRYSLIKILSSFNCLKKISIRT